METLFIIILGLLIGSFLNVCIYRIPKGISIVKPGSKCPSCEKPIKFYDNIPILSFILLKGKCRNCKTPISLRYPLVEILTAFVTMLIVTKWNSNILWMLAGLISIYILIIVSFIDFETRLIADVFSYILLLIGLVSSIINPYYSGNALHRVFQSFIGILSGGLIIWLLSVLGKKLFKKEAMGEGDIFLMAGAGSLIGLEGVFSTLIISSFVGTIYGVTLMILKKARIRDYMAFGPFIAMGTAVNIYHFIPLTTFLFM